MFTTPHFVRANLERLVTGFDSQGGGLILWRGFFVTRFAHRGQAEFLEFY